MNIYPLYLIVNEQLRVVWLDNHGDSFVGAGMNGQFGVVYSSEWASRVTKKGWRGKTESGP